MTRRLSTGPRADAPAVRAIRRLPLHDAVVAHLREMIQSSELPPGSKINENALCSEFEISRTPLREALKVLAAEGLVELRPRRGAIVAPIARADVAATFEVLSALERLAGEMACRNASAADLDELERMHAQLIIFHQRRARLRYFQLNRAIHARMVALAGNPVLEGTYANCSARVARARALANHNTWRWQESVDEHEAIMEAFRAQNAALAANLMETHSRLTGQAVIQALADLEEHRLDTSRSRTKVPPATRLALQELAPNA
jgi:DNA-binding GntR family transcriptional regulator